MVASQIRKRILVQGVARLITAVSQNASLCDFPKMLCWATAPYPLSVHACSCVYVCAHGCVHIHICVFEMSANVGHAMATARRLKFSFEKLLGPVKSMISMSTAFILYIIKNSALGAPS